MLEDLSLPRLLLLLLLLSSFTDPDAEGDFLPSSKEDVELDASTLISRTVKATNTAMKLATTPDNI
jgi:hypothetical protein